MDRKATMASTRVETVKNKTQKLTETIKFKKNINNYNSKTITTDLSALDSMLCM